MNKNQTSKLNPKLFKNGYEYTILRKNQSNIRWKCNKVTCTGKVTTNLNEPYELFTKWTDHKNHESSDEVLKLKNLALTYMKSRSLNSRESTNQILLSVLHENNENVRNKIGNTDSIRRTIRRARRKNVPGEPRSMQFVLPEKWKTTMG